MGNFAVENKIDAGRMRKSALSLSVITETRILTALFRLKGDFLFIEEIGCHFRKQNG